MGTRLVHAVEVDRLSDALAFDEDTSAYSLALEKKRLVFYLCRYALLDIDKLCFHAEHTTAKGRFGAREGNMRDRGPHECKPKDIAIEIFPEPKQPKGETLLSTFCFGNDIPKKEK